MHKSVGLIGYAATFALLVAGAAGAHAGQVYSYVIEYPGFGRIGTYTDTVEEDGDTRRIDTKLRVAVKVLGIVVHREEADRTELWRGNRLVAFHGITTVNGAPIEVRGEARGDGFLITSPAGTVLAPAGIYPSSPWSARLSAPTLMMSTKTGKVETVIARGGEPSLELVYGMRTPVRHYEFVSDKHQEVWLDPRGVPVRFRTEQRGHPIEFFLADGAIAALSE